MLPDFVRLQNEGHDDKEKSLIGRVGQALGRVRSENPISQHAIPRHRKKYYLFALGWVEVHGFYNPLLSDLRRRNR